MERKEGLNSQAPKIRSEGGEPVSLGLGYHSHSTVNNSPNLSHDKNNIDN